MKYRILAFSHGKIKGWSGTNYYFYTALRKRCYLVGIIDSMSFIPGVVHKLLLKKHYHNFTKKYFSECAKVWEKKIRQVRKPFDLIFQVSFFPLIKYNVPFVIYLDVTMKDWYRGRLSASRYTIPRKHIEPPNYYSVKRESSLYKAALRIFTFSEYIKKAIVKDYGVNPRRVITVGAGPNILRLPKVDKYYDGKTILFIGKNIFRKGGNILLEAFKKVKEEIPDAKLIVVSSHLKKLSKGKNLKRYGIVIKGFMDKKLICSLYRKASVFVMPSLYEPFGIVFLEAMAYKLPCIGTNICAIPEIIEDGKTGFLVRPNDPDELAKRIIFLLKHKTLAKKMGERGRKKVEGYYTWDRVVERILNEIETVLPKGR